MRCASCRGTTRSGTLRRNGLDLVLDLSTELKVDTDRRAQWRHLLGQLSTWTTQERDGRKAEVLQGNRFTFPTGVADMCELMPMP